MLMSSFLAAVVVLFHVGLALGANAAPGTFVRAGCSSTRYAPNTALESNLDSLLASIASSSATTYDYFTAGSSRAALLGTEATATVTGAAPSSPSAAYYSLYQCRGDLRAVDCVSCVRDAAARRLVGSACEANNAHAASPPPPLQPGACTRRVARHDDLAAAADDASSAVAYRRCGAGASDDAAFLKARDAVLAQLLDGAATAAASPAGYRKVSDSSEVRGVAQCVGDVAGADCAACLAQAVGQVKGTCGDALAADVYLAQCSVRYWANSNYFRSSQGHRYGDWRGAVVISHVRPVPVLRRPERRLLRVLRARRGGKANNAHAASPPPLQPDACPRRVARHDDLVGVVGCAGAGTSHDAAFIKARDAVLAQLQDGAAAASPAGYRKVSHQEPEPDHGLSGKNGAARAVYTTASTTRPWKPGRGLR
ncbi:hypothetical protein QOZ80_2BG0194720 [Eleusine coracana subsp. coracana]|nr:hypothetical protein QOZ80_2BG0194720 [Eleusine coracana subsp. coracana]